MPSKRQYHTPEEHRVGPPRIFVSHSHEDDAFGIKLVEDLRRALRDDDAVWYDAAGGLLGGDAWWSKIIYEITTRPVFVVILSPAAMNAKYVLTEFDIAFRQWHSAAGKHIIPVLYQPCETRDDIKLLQTVSFVAKPYEQAFDDLLRALQAAELSSPATVLSTPFTQPISSLSEQPLRQIAQAILRPRLDLVRTRMGRMQDSRRLTPNTGHSISLQNVSDSAAFDICAVLFPSSTYLKKGILTRHLYDLKGRYWRGQASTGAVPRQRRKIYLEETRRPLHGNDRVTPEYTLYAPEEPMGRDQLFLSARLTITYRDEARTALAIIFDLEAERLAEGFAHAWRRIAGPIEVEYDLRELTELVKILRPPLYTG